LANYTTIHENWRRKHYAFEFLEWINSVIEKQFLDELHKSRFHTLIEYESKAFIADSIYKNKVVKY
jgi:hypothetical protein